MNIKLLGAVYGVLLAALSAPFAAQAQQSGPAANPADPAAPVPALVYVSTFQDVPRPTDVAQTPDKVWRAANDALSALPNHGGHAGHGAQQPVEQAHGHHAPAAPAAQQPVQKAAPQPAAAHGKHHH